MLSFRKFGRLHIVFKIWMTGLLFIAPTLVSAGDIDHGTTTTEDESSLASNPDPELQNTNQSPDGDAILTAPQKPDRWSFGVGFRIRNFSEVEFSAQPFRNSGNSPTGTPASGPGDTPANRAAALTNGPYGVQNVTSPLGPPTVTVSNSLEGIDDGFGITIPLDTISFDGSTDRADDRSAAGLMAFCEVPLLEKDLWTFGLRTGLSYHRVRSGTTHNGDMSSADGFTTFQFIHGIIDIDPNPIDGVITGVINPAQTAANSVLAGTTTQFAVENRLGLDLAVFDLGLTASRSTERLVWDLAAGPTLTVSRLSTSQRLTASWSDIPSSFPNPPFTSPLATVNSDTYSIRESDASTRISVGAFMSAGFSTAINDSITVGAHYRIDIVSRKANTDQAQIDLDGHSFGLFWLYAY